MMKTCSKCGETKPEEQFYPRYGQTGLRKECKRCAIARAGRWAQANPERVRAKLKQWHAVHSPDKVKQAAASARTQKKYPARFAARSMAYYAGKRQAIPTWANEFFIAEIYDLAALRTKLTGIEWHVDHIVPLKSKLVCGLHIEHNLQVVPAKINLSKSNRHWPDMPSVGANHG